MRLRTLAGITLTESAERIVKRFKQRMRKLQKQTGKTIGPPIIHKILPDNKLEVFCFINNEKHKLVLKKEQYSIDTNNE